MLQRIGLLLCLSEVLSSIEGIQTWHTACVYALLWAWGLLTEQTVINYINNNKGPQ